MDPCLKEQQQQHTFIGCLMNYRSTHTVGFVWSHLQPTNGISKIKTSDVRELL